MKVFVTGLFSLNQDIPAFKEHLRDFLVQIKVRDDVWLLLFWKTCIWWLLLWLTCVCVWLTLLWLTCVYLDLQEFAGEDTTDLFLEERETSLRQAQEEKHKIQMSVPGILNPHELPEEMCD